jgi:hypothetical protein
MLDRPLLRRAIVTAATVMLAPLVLVPVMETAHAGGSRLDNTSAPTYQTNGRVSAIIVVRNTIYIGGDFTAVRPSGAAPGTREVPRAHLAAFRADNGKLRSWNPGANGAVSALATSADHKLIYVGGSFSRLAGARRHNVGAVKAANGAATRFHANTNGEVLALYRTRSRLYLGGSFTNVKHTHRKRVAALALGGRLIRTWHPGTNNSVRTIQVSRDRTKVYLGGEFNIVNGHNEPHLAKLSTTGKLLRWRRHPGFPVWQIVLGKKRVFAGGNGPGGRIAAFTTGGRKVWSVQADGGVQTIALSDGALLAGGHFRNVCVGNIGGPQIGFDCLQVRAPRAHLLALSPKTGALRPWKPHANSGLGVFSLATSASTVYAGGVFTEINEAPQQAFVGFPRT